MVSRKYFVEEKVKLLQKRLSRKKKETMVAFSL